MQEKGFVEYVKECLTLKYKDFSGRARRREFWFFWLCCILTNCVASVIDHAIGLHSILSTIVALALFIPILAAGVRRLQDIGTIHHTIILHIYSFHNNFRFIFFL